MLKHPAFIIGEEVCEDPGTVLSEIGFQCGGGLIVFVCREVIADHDVPSTSGTKLHKCGLRMPLAQWALQAAAMAGRCVFPATRWEMLTRLSITGSRESVGQ